MILKSQAIRERDIEEYLVARVGSMGGEVRKVKWVGRRGAPDRLVMLPAHKVADAYVVMPSSIWVELKKPGVAPEPHQLREHARMRAMGQRVEVIDSFAGVEELFA